MGARYSTSETAPAISESTAKVITPEGQLREYAASDGSQLITAALTIADFPSYSSSHFLCDADALFLDEPVQPLTSNNRLLPDRLYFLLPEKMSRHPLSGTDMGALAVRATKALQDSRSASRKTTKKGTGRTRGKKDRYRRLGCAKCRVTSSIVSYDIQQLREAPMPVKIDRPPYSTAAVQRRGGSIGNRRRVIRRVSFRLRLGTIHEETAH